MIVDCAVYDEGRRVEGPPTLDALGRLETDGPRADGRFAWVGLEAPDGAELTEVLHALGHTGDVPTEAVIGAHRRPVITIEPGMVRFVLRTAHYVDGEETIVLGELAVLLLDRAVVTVRTGPSEHLSELRTELEADPERLDRGPAGVLAEILIEVIASYSPVLDGFEQDVIEVEADVFSLTGAQPIRRVYRLKREILEFQSQQEALDEPLERLTRHLAHANASRAPVVDPSVVDDLVAAADRLDRTIARTRSMSTLLDAALTASLAQTGIKQNEDVRRISAWAAMAAVPTLIASVYGMNFEAMPELDWTFGYPVALAAMALMVTALYVVFKRKGWL